MKHKTAEVSFEALIYMPCLPVSLRVVGGADAEFRTSRAEKELPKLVKILSRSEMMDLGRPCKQKTVSMNSLATTIVVNGCFSGMKCANLETY